MKKTLVLSAAVLFAFGGVAKAVETGTGGTLALSGQVDASVTLTFHQHIAGGGFTISTGDGSAAASASLSTVSMYGTPDGIVGGTNFTKSTQSDGFSLAGTFDVQVDKANTNSTDFTLTARLQSADGLGWTLNGDPVTNGSNTTLTSTGTYGLRTPFAMAVKIPNTVSAGSQSNTINFTVTVN